jgi:hypothetical protein
MQTTRRLSAMAAMFAIASLLHPARSEADDAKSAYPTKAPIEQYRMAPSEEIALARSAAPASISGKAAVLVLGDHGYETAVPGTNGFVCVVERSWATGFDDAEFWNPKLRAPNCFNAAAARSVLSIYLKRTEWVMSGASKPEMVGRQKAETAANRLGKPEPGSICYMMSKQGYLGDGAGHWHPHVMLYALPAEPSSWGADLEGSPIFASRAAEDGFTTFYVRVPAWSDGTPEDATAH